jgi:hypothetical protein
VTAKTHSDPFPRRLTATLAAVGAVCLIGSLVSLFLPGPRPDPGETAGADSTSRSAIGHRALVDFLRSQGVPVTVSRHDTARRTSGASLLLVIEPLAARIGEDGGRLAGLVRDARCPVLVVLPKFRPIETGGDPPRLRDVERLPKWEIEAVLRALDPRARLAPPAPSLIPAWTGLPPEGTPDLLDPQLVKAPGWRPVIAAEHGVLASDQRADDMRVGFLADPDLIANFGLHRRPNPAIVFDFIARLRAGDGPVLVDETLHGLAVPASFWAQLFSFPLGLATLQAALAVTLLFWAGARRFGPPEPAPPPYEPGKAVLIAHTAQLLEAGGHHVESVMRYATLVADEAARRQARKTAAELSGLEAEASGMAGRTADARAALGVARRLNKLRQEIVHGSDVRTGAR